MNLEEQNETLVGQMAATMFGDGNAEVAKYLSPLAMAGAAVIGGALYYYLNGAAGKSGNNGVMRIISNDNQSREVKGRTDGARVVTVSPTDQLLSCYYEDARTLYEVFLKARKISNNGDYLGWKPAPDQPFKWLKYSQVAELSQELGSAFLHFGLEPHKQSFVGIYARNRPEWSITDQACNTYSLVSVPLYDTLGPESINFILIQTELKIVVCDDSEKALQLMNAKSNLEYVIIIEKISDEVRKKADGLGLKVLSFEEAKEIGRGHLKMPNPPSPEDLVTVCYTSGTTGKPKGALISHGNVVSVASSMVVYMKTSGLLNIKEQDRYLSYLPLAHMFERVCQAVLVLNGGKIAFFQGDVRKLIDDMKEVKPTVFCTVPRLLNRIYSKISENINTASPLKKKLFSWSYAQKEKEVLRGVVRNNSIYDFAFKQIRDSLGGCVRLIITGSAPIAPEVLHFMRVVSGCHVLEGYGTTETGGASGVQVPGETTVGNVGPPFPCSYYKLADVSEMNLVARRDNRGEICIYGNNIFKGYYKDEEKTKEALDSEGWYHTGDIGSWAENGTLKVVDRVKNIFKLQQGEYIAPEKIESIYVRSKYVAQVFIYGNSYKSTLVGIVVPEQTVLFEWARENSLVLDMVALCKNTEFKAVLLKDLIQLGKSGGLKGFEQVKDILVYHDLFTVEQGLLTPTLKSKRPELQKYFQKNIDEMYSHLE